MDELASAKNEGYFMYNRESDKYIPEYRQYCLNNKRPYIEVEQQRKYTSIKVDYTTTEHIGLNQITADKLNDILDDFVILDYLNKKEVNKIPAGKEVFVIEYLTNEISLDFLAATLTIFFNGVTLE